MCEISDKLKLCTCKTNVSGLKNTWTYYKYKGPGETNMMGEPIMPVELDPALEKANIELLQQLLNDGNVFDFEITPKYRDRLELSFDLSDGKEDRKMLFYEFVYRKGAWQPARWEPFYHQNNMNEASHGKVVNGLKKNSD